MKMILIVVGAVVLVGFLFFSWSSVAVIVPQDFRGLVKVVEASNGERLAPVFPRINVGANGVARIRSIERLRGFLRVTAGFANGKSELSNRREPDTANPEKVFFWELPRSINREAYFYVGTSAQYQQLMKDEKFLRELGRDRRSEGAPFGNDSKGVPIPR